MVEVIVAFAVLVLILGIFSQAMGLTQRMMIRAGDTLSEARSLARDYYLGEETPDHTQDVGLTFHLRSGSDSISSLDSFEIDATIRTYERGDGAIWDVTAR